MQLTRVDKMAIVCHSNAQMKASLDSVEDLKQTTSESTYK